MAGAFDVEHIPVNKTNLGVTLLSSAISSSAETIAVNSAAILPAAKFYATITPAGGISDSTNSEIILVRSVSGNTLTVTRGVRGTAARAFDAGSVLFNGVYYQDSPYDASEIITTQNETYTDVQGLIAAINDGRPVIMNQYLGTSDFGGQVIMTSATLTDTKGILQTITIKYIMGERLVTVDIDPTTGAITRSGVNIATSGNKIITGSMIRNNTITADNVDFTTLVRTTSLGTKEFYYRAAWAVTEVYSDLVFNVQSNSKYLFIYNSGLWYNKGSATSDMNVSVTKRGSNDFNVQVASSYSMNVAGASRTCIGFVDVGNTTQVHLDVKFNSGATGTISAGAGYVFLIRIG